jgi:hypothetical protein
MVLHINTAWCAGCQKYIHDPYPAIIKRELFACCYVATPGCRQHGILEEHVPIIISRQPYHDMDDESRFELYDRIIDNLGCEVTSNSPLDEYNDDHKSTYQHTLLMEQALCRSGDAKGYFVCSPRREETPKPLPSTGGNWDGPIWQ